MRHIGTRLALTCSLVLLSACSERVSFLAPKFQMGSNSAQALVVTPDGEVHESGKLTVSIRGFLDKLAKQRRVLATLSDVEKVVVEVSASGLSFSQTIAKADITGGTTTATFTGIPEGAATVTMKAYNASNQLIGQASKATAVTAGNTTTVEIQLQLDPTYTQPSTGGSTSTGSITANGTILDGPVIAGSAGAVIASYELSEVPKSLAVDATGVAWVATPGEIRNVLPDGTSTVNGAVVGTWDLAIDALGQLWTSTWGDASTQAYDSALSPSGGSFYITGMAEITFDSTGKMVYLGNYGDAVNTVERITVTGTDREYIVGGELPSPANPVDVTVDSDGNYWVLGYSPEKSEEWQTPSPELYNLSKYGADGKHIGTFSLPLGHGSWVSRVASDNAGQIWVTHAGADSVSRFASDGSLLGTHQVGTEPAAIAVDTYGNTWVANRGSNSVTKLSPSGAILGTFAVEAEPFELAAGPEGIWVAHSGSNRILLLTP